MTVLFATTYHWTFYLFSVGWPVANWLGAIAIVYVTFLKVKSRRVLLPALVPILSAAWLGLNHLRQPEGSLDGWTVFGFVLPGLIAMILSVLTLCRSKRRSM